MTYAIFQDNAFYWGTIRNLITGVGQLFQNLQIQKLDAAGEKQQVIQVPCSYGPRNKWLSMIKERPDYTQGVEITMPRISYEITDYRYDANRKIGAQSSYRVGDVGGRRTKVYNPVPYDVYINLYSYCKDQTDSLQILEQILPYFAPSLTISMIVHPVFNIVKDIPIVLTGVSVEDTFEGDVKSFRTVTQTFSMVAQLDLFGPINTRKEVIKHANVGVNMTSVPTDGTIDYSANVVPDTANKTDNYIITESWMNGF